MAASLTTMKKTIGLVVFTLSMNSIAGATPENESVETKFAEDLARVFHLDSIPGFREVLDGLNPNRQSTVCDLQALEQSLLEKDISSKTYFTRLKSYFKKCESELADSTRVGVPGFLTYMYYKYDFFSHPQVQEVRIPLSNGAKALGILALRQDPAPRPLVVFRCGVFCSATESSSTRSYLMALFDQSPFNVLILANQTGIDVTAVNRIVSMGGWSEGQESMEIGKWLLQKWSLRGRISSLHYMGASLGGNSAVFASLYNDQMLLEDGQKIFQSVAAICPVISLRPTLEKLYSAPGTGAIFFKLSRDHLKESGAYVTDVPDLLTEKSLPLWPSEMGEFIGKVAATSWTRRGLPMTTAGFFKMNNFWNLKGNPKTPLLVWASKDDIVVNNEVNTQVLEDDDRISTLENVGVVNLKYGSHCGFTSIYGAQTVATVLRSFVLAHSPEFKNTYTSQTSQAWSFENFSVHPSLEHESQHWSFEVNTPTVAVTFRFLQKGFIGCRGGPQYLLPYCFTQKTVRVPIASLRALKARIPSTEAEAHAESREFNSKVELWGRQSRLTGTQQSPAKLVWRTAY